MPDDLLVERRGQILVMTLNRPGAANAIDASLGGQLADAVTALDADDDVRVGVLAGKGPGFCAGMDLKAFSAAGVPERFARLLHTGSVKPLIAAVEGFALAGGLELALTCDLIVAARGAKFGLPEAKVGFFAAGGGVLRLPDRVPHGVAAEMLLTGRTIVAEDAHGYGLVARLVDAGEAVGVALELAEAITANAPLGVQASKVLLRDRTGRTEQEFWDVQATWYERVFASADAEEGALAFAEKRRPNWRGI